NITQNLNNNLNNNPYGNPYGHPYGHPFLLNKALEGRNCLPRGHKQTSQVIFRMGKNAVKRGYKVRGKKVNAEPSTMAEEVEVSEFSTAEVDAAEGASGHRTRAEDTARGVSVCDTVRKTKKTV